MFDFASYHRAATLADAINLLVDNPQAKLLSLIHIYIRRHSWPYQ